MPRSQRRISKQKLLIGASYAAKPSRAPTRNPFSQIGVICTTIV
jgi:hypothetical protein